MMKKSLKAALSAATLAAGVMLAGAASAATLTFTGSGQTQLVNNNDLGLGLNGTTIDFISGNLKTALNGLGISGVGPFEVKFTYLGREAGNTNYSIFSGLNTLFLANAVVGSVKTQGQSGPGLIDFGFGTSSPVNAVGLIENDGVAVPNSPNYAIGYKKLSDTSYLVLFDDIASGDRDFDDHGVQIDISVVPLPAGGVLLLTAFAGFAALRRRKAA